MEKKPPKLARITHSLKHKDSATSFHNKIELNFFFLSSKNSQENEWKVNSVCICSALCHLSPSFLMSAEELRAPWGGGGAASGAVGGALRGRTRRWGST